MLSAVHPRHGIPHRSLVALGLVASAFCFFSLQQGITMLVITRILLQFFIQQIGVMLLRVQRPELPRPFRIPFYPLPPLAAMAGFLFILVNRKNATEGLAVAAGIGVSGTLIYLVRAKRLRQWPFAGQPSQD
jgi:amino acid transporter